MIDKDAERVKEAANSIDCAVVLSDGNSPAALEEAGISSADALVAVTEQDEVNLITCSYVEAHFPNVFRIARVRNYVYYKSASPVDGTRRVYGIDRAIHPNVVVADAILVAVHGGIVGEAFDLGAEYGIVCLTVESGSTAGGIKVIRWTVLAKQMHSELLRFVHPHGVYTLRINGSARREGIVSVVGSFVLVYFVLVFLTTVVGALGGLDAWTAFTAALSMVGNVGPAFGALGPTANCGFLPAAVKVWYCLAMLAGRLEIFTLIAFALVCIRRCTSAASAKWVARRLIPWCGAIALRLKICHNTPDLPNGDHLDAGKVLRLK